MALPGLLSNFDMHLPGGGDMCGTTRAGHGALCRFRFANAQLLIVVTEEG